MADTFDLIVIGSGPGGYVAAIRAAQLGMKTAIVERENLGGICLNWGCIPTKALLKTGEVFEKLSHLGDYGLSATGASFDFDKVVQRSRGVAKTLSGGIAFLMKKNKIEVIEGTASLEKATPAPKVMVALKAGGSRSLTAKAVVLATGARARVIPAVGLVPDGEKVWTYREAMVPKAAPKSLIVVGSGAIGIEFASFYQALGAEVTVIEALDRILPVEDADVSAAAQKAFEKRGLKFRVAAKVTKLVKDKAGVSIDLEAGGKAETLKAEVAIVAVGIEGNVENMGLEALGLKIDRGHVVTDDHGGTNVPGLYAIGDVAGPPWLAHKASHEGIHCVEHIAGRAGPVVHSPIPGCTYSEPQIASVGLTEAQAKDKKLDVKVGRYPFKNHGKAIASGDTEGFVKTVFDAKTGQLLGAHMIGAEVTEMIQGFVIAMTLEATEAELMQTVFPHPTMSEAMHEATLAAYGQAIHM
ncbi:MAG TPA: dihydrolipoyl dehydrogenase [Caulobacteraceae bacterium]|jgi:dihydrolipoamide dehydrogenase|nr:dihydrolipoyl dehydrogenase [Caulobacteraceae bacterium]